MAVLNLISVDFLRQLVVALSAIYTFHRVVGRAVSDSWRLFGPLRIQIGTQHLQKRACLHNERRGGSIIRGRLVGVKSTLDLVARLERVLRACLVFLCFLADFYRALLKFLVIIHGWQLFDFVGQRLLRILAASDRARRSN